MTEEAEFRAQLEMLRQEKARREGTHRVQPSQPPTTMQRMGSAALAGPFKTAAALIDNLKAEGDKLRAAGLPVGEPVFKGPWVPQVNAARDKLAGGSLEGSIPAAMVEAATGKLSVSRFSAR